jgi:integrase
MRCPVHLYYAPTGKYPAWLVVYKRDGKRIRQKFSDEKEAKKFYKELVANFEAGRMASVTEAERAGIARLRELARECGLELETLVADRADGAKLVPGVSVIELARFWQVHHGILINKTVPEVYAELLAAKRSAGLSFHYLEDIKHRCGRFAEAFKVPISGVSGKMIGSWIAQLRVSARTQNQFRRLISVMFEFAKAQGYLDKSWSELDAVGTVKVPDRNIEIFTLEEMQKLLNAAKPHQLPFLAIGAFAGIRHEEIKRLNWGDLSGSYIKISAGITKTASRRLVPIQPNLMAILAPYRKPHGPVTERSAMMNQMEVLAKDAGVNWVRNGLRHSYISYRIAIVEDVAKVALECGNSPEIIFKHYRELVTKESAEKWFGLTQNVPKIS